MSTAAESNDQFNLEDFDTVQKIEHLDHPEGKYRLVTLGNKKGVFSITHGKMVVPLTEYVVQILAAPSIQKTDYIIWLVRRNSDDNLDYLYTCSKYVHAVTRLSFWDNRNFKLYNIVNPNVIILKPERAGIFLRVSVIGNLQKDSNINIDNKKINGIRGMQNNRFMIMTSSNNGMEHTIYIFKEDGSLEDRVDMAA